MHGFILKSFFGLSYAEDFNKCQKDIENIKGKKSIKN